MTTITKRVEFDAGHRVPSHNSKCKNAHGHRYMAEICLGGPVLAVRGKSDDGMILDFAVLKKLIMIVIEDWDHAFLVYDGDHQMLAALELLGSEHKTAVLPVIPTAENLAWVLGVRLSNKVLTAQSQNQIPGGIGVVRVRLYETPTSWADWVPEIVLNV